MLNILYFASLRERLDCSNEQLSFSESVNSITSLKQTLASRGNAWEETFTKYSYLVSINQEMVNNNQSINDGDEIAFFPQVTGG